jgi:outer membrane protein assembly factor BamB
MRSSLVILWVVLVCLVQVGSSWGWSLESANGVSDEKNLVSELRDEDLLWSIELGTHQYSVPIIKDGRIYLGLNDQGLEHETLKKTGGGIEMCIDQKTGDMLWQMVIPRYMEGTKAPFHFNQWRCGVCSMPAIEGKRMYIVGSRGDVLCLDREGQTDGNDGPFTAEGSYMGYPDGDGARLARTDGDIIWRYDLITELSVVPHDVCGSSAVLYGGCLYVCTSNGVDDTHKKVAQPLSPSLVALDKNTGRLVAADGELIGKRMFHGHWSSPVVARIGDKVIILFGGGDGVLYAFEPASAAKTGAEVATLKKIWEYDCNPADYRIRDGQAIPYTNWRDKSPDGPSEVISTAVVHDGQIYVAIGQSPVHGQGNGALSCVDGDGKEVWRSALVGRSLCSVSVADGLLFIGDYSKQLHCFDAATGERYWVHDVEAGVWSGSTFAADGKVYVGTEGNVLWAFRAGRDKEMLWRKRMDSAPITLAADSGVLYVPTQRFLYAYRAGEATGK